MLGFLKPSFKSSKAVFAEITPEFLQRQKEKLPGDGYLKWLRDKSGQLSALMIVKQETVGKAPEEWKDKIHQVEQAIERESH